MRVLVSGASGLVGSALVRRLSEPGAAPEPAQVLRLVRRPPRPQAGEIAWDPQAGQLSPEALEGLDAVVHLAGENIGAGRWTADKKARIRASRVEGTSLFARALARLARPPRVLVCASAVGWYGDRGEEELDEASPPGTGFLAGVCREWEAATEPAASAGVRVVLARFGVILARHGGALGRMLPLFRWGLGGRLGSGRQYMSWIALDDAVRAIQFLLDSDALRGPVNVVAPRPVTNREFTAALGRVLRRPALCAAPAFMLRLALGEMADEMLLAGARAVPRRLAEQGFVFDHPELESALARLLAPSGP